MGFNRKQDKNLLRQKQRSQSERDSPDDLWADVAKTITPLNKPLDRLPLIDPANSPSKRDNAPSSPIQGGAKTKLPIPQPLHPPPFYPSPPDQTKGYVSGPVDLSKPDHAGINKADAKRLKKGDFLIEARLDLHGLTQSQARGRLEDFIASSVKNELKCVLIITGKGREGQGVLKQILPKWLSSPPLSDHVNAKHPAKGKHGGEGAYYVKLKRQRGTL